MSPEPVKDWDNLGIQLIERRTQLDPRYRNRRLFASEHGMNWRLLHDIERHKRENFEPETLMAVASAYQVTYQSVLAALDGAQLEPDDRSPAAQLVPDLLPAARLPSGESRAVYVLGDDLSPAIEAEVRRAQLRNQNATGRDIFLNPDEANIWDMVTPGLRAKAVALLRAIRQAEEDEDFGPGYPRHAK